MSWNGWLQIALFGVVVVALVKPLGLYMTQVFEGERTFLSPVLRPVERWPATWEKPVGSWRICDRWIQVRGYRISNSDILSAVLKTTPGSRRAYGWQACRSKITRYDGSRRRHD
ncbi:MAG TPA: hypothetical protein VFE34_04505 [Dongiaceae bacterium]|jgi:hypothetical protein|nr:hypothetical protein [Dongiaceae bacterium]